MRTVSPANEAGKEAAKVRAKRGAKGRTKRADPAPSMWRYRLNRMMRRRWVRALVFRWLPIGAIAGGVAFAAAQIDIEAVVQDQWRAARAAIAERPEFAVNQVEITGASPLVRADAEAALALPDRLSSLDMDPQALRTRVEKLGWVASAQVSLEAPETLRIRLVERTPAAIWRYGDRLVLVDRDGAEIAPLLSRVDWPTLPLVVGQGADSVVSEALDLYDLAERYQTRLRGFVRVGGRRWDIVFDDLRILLPEAEPDGALVRIVEIDVASLLMDRDVIVIDARDPDSLTLRLGDAARELQERTGDGPGEET